MGNTKRTYYIEMNKAPARFKDVIDKRAELLDSYTKKRDKRIQRKLSLLSSLRRSKKYQGDKREFRRAMGIPLEGNSRWEVRKHFKKIEGTEIETMLMGAVMDFADRHPLDKRHPMPLMVAFEELFYKRPVVNFSFIAGLRGYYKNGNVFLEDCKTEAPDEIARMVERKLKGHKHEFTDCIDIVEMYADGDKSAGFWAFTKEPPVARTRHL